MGNYDIRTMTRIELIDCLGRAKDEIVKYTRCCEKVESCKKRIEEEKKQANSKIGCGVVVMCFFIIMTIVVIVKGDSEVILSLIGLYVVCFITIIAVISKIMARKKARGNILEEETKLPDLQKKTNEAANKFRAVVEPYGIPEDYWYEYAITEMLRYVENGMADNWKEVVNKYEAHIESLYEKYSSNANSKGEKVTSKDDWTQTLKIAGGILGLTGMFLGGALRNAGKDIGK